MNIQDSPRHLPQSPIVINEENNKFKYQKKIDELEEKNRFLEHRLEQLNNENEYHRQIHEQEKRQYENLFSRTNQRLRKMEDEYRSEQMKNDEIINQMETRMIDLRTNVEHLEEEKLQLTKKISQRGENLQRQQFTIERLKRETTKTIEDLEKKLSLINEQFENLQEFFQQKLQEEKIESKRVRDELNQFNEKLEKQLEQQKNILIENERTFSQLEEKHRCQIEEQVRKTNEQLKAMEDEFSQRHSKQESIIADQQKLILLLKEEENRYKDEKFYFDQWMKTTEKNVESLQMKKENLQKKLSYLNKEHQKELIECRLSYETCLKGFVSAQTRIDLENTIYSLKQQILFLQQRIAFLQGELDQYIDIYGHRPSCN